MERKTLKRELLIGLLWKEEIDEMIKSLFFKESSEIVSSEMKQ